MQKIFIKYTSVIMTLGILLILSFNFGFTLHNLEKEQYDSFCGKIEQVVHTLETNRMELELMNENLDMDYLTRAKAAAYMMEHQEGLSMDVAQMQYLAALLDVDELHIIDDNGIIVAGSVSEYVGIDMAEHEQTRPFLDLLGREGDDAYLIQDEQPNAAEGKVMKYVGVCSKEGSEVVQVGFKPVRQMEAQARNSYDYIFSRFPTDEGEELFVLDAVNGRILGHSGGMDREFCGEYFQLGELLGCMEGAYRTDGDGKEMYVVSKQFEDVLICTALPKTLLLRELWTNVVLTLLYLLLVEAVVIVSLNYLVRRKVIDGIHGIIENLSAITQGNLDIRVKQGGNREFEELSSGINTMVDSIVSITGRTSRIIELSGIPLAAFEYEGKTGHLFVTSGLKDMLDMQGETAEEICGDSALFENYIRAVMEGLVPGETDIYKISDTRFVRIHMSQSKERCLGVITDTTKYIMEKQRMQYENTHDPLTGLYKYPYFKQVAAEIVRKLPEGQSCAAVMLDLDAFKTINDTFGHDAGDRYLQGFAYVLRTLPKEHVLTARRSGDEFCMMIYGCGEKGEFGRYLDMLYGALASNPVTLSEQERRVIGVSCGFAWTVDAGTELSELIAHADEALYEVKRETKGQYREYRAAGVTVADMERNKK